MFEGEDLEKALARANRHVSELYSPNFQQKAGGEDVLELEEGAPLIL